MADFMTASGLGAAVAGGTAVPGMASEHAGPKPAGDFAALMAEMAEVDTDRAATESDSQLLTPARGLIAASSTWVVPPQLQIANTTVLVPDNDNAAPMGPEPAAQDMLDTDMPQPEMRFADLIEDSGIETTPGADPVLQDGDTAPSPEVPPPLQAADATAETTPGAERLASGSGRFDGPTDIPEIGQTGALRSQEPAAASPARKPDSAAPQPEDGASTGTAPRTPPEGGQPVLLTQPGPTPVEAARPGGPAAAPPAPPPTASPEVRIAATTTDNGGSIVEIALSPAELGKVRMIIGADAAQLGVTVLAERPETLELLRRNIDLLAAELASLGYDTAGLGFTFGREDAEGRGAAAAEMDRPFPEQVRPVADVQSPSGPILSLNRLNLRL
jgi:flagellar hook-length control protein FliK